MTSSVLISSSFGMIRMAIKQDGRLINMEVATPWHKPTLGNVYAAKVLAVDHGLNAAFLKLGPEEEGFLRAGDYFPKIVKSARLSDYLKPGRDLLVQVQKAPAAGKRLPCSMSIGLAGFHSIYFPNSNQVKFSKRFAGDKTKNRNWIRNEFSEKKGGWLLRSSSALVSSTVLERELHDLVNRWSRIEETFSHSAEPRLLDTQDSDPVRRFFSGVLSSPVDNVYLDDAGLFEKIMDWARQKMPSFCDRIFLHSGSSSLFSTYGIDRAFQEVCQNRIWLKSGGYLLFNKTEALTVIDVNSGKASAGEKMKFQVNCQAAEEAARHILLRDLGGIIVIDFINLQDSQQIREIESVFMASLGKEHLNCRIEPINALGILSLSRRRQRSSTLETFALTCTQCQGTGYVKGFEMVALDLFSELDGLYEPGDHSGFSISAGELLYEWMRSNQVSKFLPEEWNVTLIKSTVLKNNHYKVSLNP